MDEVKTASAVAPMRGRGTALAVDEVPTQAPDFVDFPVHRLRQGPHCKPEPGAARGAGEGTVSVGSRCPRLESVRRGKPLQPTLAGAGLRPAGAREGEHPPAVQQRGNASLAAIWKVRRTTFKVTSTFRRVKAFPS